MISWLDDADRFYFPLSHSCQMKGPPLVDWEFSEGTTLRMGLPPCGFLGLQVCTHKLLVQLPVWHTMILPSAEGGLGIIDPEMLSCAILVKLLVQGLFPVDVR